MFAVFIIVCMRFRPLRYYIPCQVYTTLRTIITSNGWLVSVHLTNIFRKLICRVHWPYNQYVFDRSILNLKKISVRLLSVLRGHSFFSSPPQRPMTSDFEGFLYQILSITLFSYLNSWERASIFLFNVQC